MVLGLVMLTASWGTSLEGWVICYAWSLFIYSKHSPVSHAWRGIPRASFSNVANGLGK